MQRTVLIVDDYAPFRRLARRLLEAGGFNVVGEAAAGASALAAVVELQPQIVLLDVLLPDMHGLAVAERIAALPNPPQVVLTSSREAAEFGTRLEQARASGFIQKDELSAGALCAVASDEL